MSLWVERAQDTRVWGDRNPVRTGFARRREIRGLRGQGYKDSLGCLLLGPQAFPMGIYTFLKIVKEMTHNSPCSPEPLSHLVLLTQREEAF